MKFQVLFVMLLCMSVVAAEIDTYPSGIFRGSMRHVITLENEPVTIPNVAAGDYLAFAFPNTAYPQRDKHEEVEVYVRRYDKGNQIVTYDVEQQKYMTLEAGESALIDIDANGEDDIELTFEKVDLRAEFSVVLLAAENDSQVNESCPVACISDEMCLTVCSFENCIATCENPGTCEAACSFETAEPEEPAQDVQEPQTEPEIKKGWFTRFLEWLARLG